MASSSTTGLTTGAWPFVARDRELELLAETISSRSHPGIVIEGPAGVGKSRLAAECLRRAQDSGFEGVRVVGTRAAAAMPLGALASLVPPHPCAASADLDMVRHAADTIASRSGGDPLLVVVDDAHLLDEMSAVTLHKLMTTERACVVATVRTGEPISDAILSLWHDGAALRIDLDAFDRSGTDALVRAILDGPVDGALLRDVFKFSAGNALFVCELLRGSIDEDLLREETGIWRATLRLTPSPRLHEVLSTRLEERSDRELGALELIALGEPLRLDHLERLVDLDDIEALELAGLVDVRIHARPFTVQLAHPLYGEIVRARITATRSLRLHRRLADSLEETGALDPGDIARTTVWRLDGGDEVQPELVLAAARHAYLGSGDLGLAERVARTALDSDVNDDTRLLLAEVLAIEGRHGELDALLDDLELDDDERAARLAMLRAQALFRRDARRDEADAVLEGAAALDAGVWSAAAVAQRAIFDLLAGDPQAALARVQPLLADNDPRVISPATVAAAGSLAMIGRFDEAVEVADRGKAAHDQLLTDGEVGGLGLHLVARTLALTEAGHLAEAEQTCRFGYDTSVTQGVAIDQAWFALMIGRVALMQGRPATAAGAFRESHAIFAELGHAGLQRWCLAGTVYAAALTGDTCDQALDEIDADPATALRVAEPDVGRARAWSAVARGDLVAGRVHLRDAATLARSSGSHPLEVAALHDRVRIGDWRGSHHDVAARLVELAGLVDGPLVEARVLHASGLARSDPDTLEAAVTVFANCGTELFAAEAAAAAAAAHGAKGSQRAADRCSAHSSDVAARCEGVRTPTMLLAGPAVDLTGRQREIATLAALGLSNGAIAERLHISRRTVGNHLYRCFSKLGVKRREDLANALAPRR